MRPEIAEERRPEDHARDHLTHDGGLSEPNRDSGNHSANHEDRGELEKEKDGKLKRAHSGVAMDRDQAVETCKLEVENPEINTCATVTSENFSGRFTGTRGFG